MSGTGESAERTRSSMALRYKAEVDLVKARIGGLEDIRGKLGLTRRKICQLLLVDPSAWTRWTAPGGDAPAHIYRALEWYVMLTDKDPRAHLPIGSWSGQAILDERFSVLEDELQRLSKARAGLIAIALILGFLGGAILFSIFR